jgi:hypothetical protein
LLKSTSGDSNSASLEAEIEGWEPRAAAFFFLADRDLEALVIVELERSEEARGKVKSLRDVST